MELTKAFKASRMTVNRALTALAADGLIVRWRRRGSFVAERAAELSVFEIWDIAAEIARSGRAYAYVLLARETMTADTELAADMDCARRHPSAIAYPSALAPTPPRGNSRTFSPASRRCPGGG